MYRTFYLPDSVIVPAIRFFSVTVAFFLVASWSVTGWEEPSPSQLPDIDISKSPFAEVYKYQSINGDYKEKT